MFTSDYRNSLFPKGGPALVSFGRSQSRRFLAIPIREGFDVLNSLARYMLQVTNSVKSDSLSLCVPYGRVNNGTRCWNLSGGLQ
jgi:hypothetical protein